MIFEFFFPIWNHTCIATACFQLVKFIKPSVYLSAQKFKTWDIWICFPIWNHICIATSCFHLVKFIKTRVYVSAQFWLAVPPTDAIASLNQNAIVSLDTDIITKEKVEINIRKNPHMLFLTTTNRAVNLLNTMAIKV